jgi:hypothetical protein
VPQQERSASPENPRHSLIAGWAPTVWGCVEVYDIAYLLRDRVKPTAYSSLLPRLNPRILNHDILWCATLANYLQILESSDCLSTGEAGIRGDIEKFALAEPSLSLVKD